MRFASLEANLSGGWGLLNYPILLFSLWSQNMTEILLNGTLSFNSITQICFVSIYFVVKFIHKNQNFTEDNGYVVIISKSQVFLYSYTQA